MLIVTVVAASAAALLVRPAKMHEITVPAAMAEVAGVETVSTRLVLVMLATPTFRPLQVRADVIAVVRKFTPATVIALITPAFADTVKVTVAETLVAALTVLERTIEGAVRASAVIAANVAVPVSDAVAPVVIVTVAEPCAVAEFASAATVHVT